MWGLLLWQWGERTRLFRAAGGELGQIQMLLGHTTGGLMRFYPATAEARLSRVRHPGVEVHHAEHLHAVFADGIFLLHHTDVAEAQGLDRRLDDFDMRHGPVSGRALGCTSDILIPISSYGSAVPDEHVNILSLEPAKSIRPQV
jgi:hypothetical protein